MYTWGIYLTNVEVSMDYNLSHVDDHTIIVLKRLNALSVTFL